MDGGENILDAILDEGNPDDFGDVEMLDLEEGELVEQSPKDELGGTGMADVDVEKVNQETGNKNPRQKKKRRKGKRNRAGAAPNVTDVNRFVLGVCKRLREKKSYLVYTAVAHLGVSAVADLVKEVDAIQACGGQKTADGKRNRVGGGILWNILKTRDPNAYKEIMKKGREFEKQFQPQGNNKQTTRTSTDHDLQSAPIEQNKPGKLDATEKSTNELQMLDPMEKRVSVQDRLRVPVSYSDILEREDPMSHL